MTTLPILGSVIRTISSDEGCYHSMYKVTEIMISYIKRNPAQFSNLSHDANVIRKTATSAIMIVVQD